MRLAEKVRPYLKACLVSGTSSWIEEGRNQLGLVLSRGLDGRPGGRVLLVFNVLFTVLTLRCKAPLEPGMQLLSFRRTRKKCLNYHHIRGSLVRSSTLSLRRLVENKISIRTSDTGR